MENNCLNSLLFFIIRCEILPQKPCSCLDATLLKACGDHLSAQKQGNNAYGRAMGEKSSIVIPSLMHLFSLSDVFKIGPELNSQTDDWIIMKLVISLKIIIYILLKLKIIIKINKGITFHHFIVINIDSLNYDKNNIKIY